MQPPPPPAGLHLPDRSTGQGGGVARTQGPIRDDRHAVGERGDRRRAELRRVPRP
jgi:hypothetical protein